MSQAENKAEIHSVHMETWGDICTERSQQGIRQALEEENYHINEYKVTFTFASNR